MIKNLTVLFVFLTHMLYGQVLINEYSAANYDAFQDNYGEYEDWIELYNPTANPIDLNGWYLSDKSSNPLKWQFSASFIIPANDVILVYCSGRDEVLGGNAHSNFKITQTKGNETLVISDPSGLFSDSIVVYPNQKSHSRGRVTDGAPNWGVFVTATPGGSNINVQQEYASTPVFSINPGYQAGSISLAISSPDPNISIYYTTNGDEPDNTSALYGAPVNINNTTVVKAVAYSSTANIPPSFIEYGTYFINDTHTIPILSISGDQVDNLLGGNAWIEPEGTIEWFSATGVLIDKGTGEFNKHGNDSWAYDQRGFDYVMRDQFGYNHALQDKIFDTKDRDKFQRVIVKAAANDNYPFSYGSSGAHIRDAYVNHLSQLAGLKLDERSTHSCILYLDGEYWGVYEIREKVDDHDFTDYYYDQDKNNIQYLKTWGGTWTEYGAPNAQPDWDNFKNFVLSNPMNIQANYAAAKAQYNTGSLIDYFLLNSYVVCADWLNWNTGWWRGMAPAGDKKKWRYTLWDMDNTFGHGTNYTGVPNQGVTADPCDPNSLNDPGGQGHVPIWNEMLDNDEFFDDYLNRWQDLANGSFSCANMLYLLDSMIAVIDPEMPRQIATWGGTYTEWQNNVQDLRDFIAVRCSTLNNGFVDCYQPAISGPYDVTVEIIGIGEVEMSNGNFINDGNTPWTDQTFGGLSLPFEVKSGTFQNWEVLPAGTYVYDPFVDTLSLEIQGNVTVRANFIPPTPTRTVVYDISPTGTASGITIEGNTINVFPHNETHVLGDTINLTTNIDPLYGFSYWATDSNSFINGGMQTDSFYALYHDTITLHLYELPTITAFISGNDTICDNQDQKAEVIISCTGIPPYTFTYALDGLEQASITTNISPYVIETQAAGTYTLTSFSDANEPGNISGQALVTVLNAPVANFEAQPDSMTILYTTTNLIDKSLGNNIVYWEWDFGDNSGSDYSSNPTHTYLDSIAIYKVGLVVEDEHGCSDTLFKHITITDDYWIYIPNSFTPDSDKLNDKFCISYHGIRENTFIFNVYNRSGDLVYSTENIEELNCSSSIGGWNGKHQENSKKLSQDTYVYHMYFQDFEGGKREKRGYIYLIR